MIEFLKHCIKKIRRFCCREIDNEDLVYVLIPNNLNN